MRNESDQAEVWKRHIEAAKAFAGSARAYCRHVELAPSSFYLWRRKLSEGSARVKAVSPFLPIVVSKPPEAQGRALPDAAWIAKVLIEVVRECS